MRSIDKIRDDMEKSLAMGGFHYNQFEQELRAAYTDGIPLNRLEEICNAEREGRLIIKPDKTHCAYCKKPTGNSIYCSNACKQAKYRERKKSAEQAKERELNG